MKTLMILLCCASASWACAKGCYPYEGGICVCDINPETAPSVQPSDEKPPEDKLPSYQREGVHVVDLPSLAAQDAKQDAEAKAAGDEGKKAAGIK